MNLTILEGDAIERMRTMSTESVHLIVTSPPYYGLRDYKIPSSVFGGDSHCEHEFGSAVRKPQKGASRRLNADSQGKHSYASESLEGETESQFCQKCSAWRGTFGLEPTPELYVEHAVEIFREAWRVLRKDGTFWLNLGDSYSNASKWGGQSGGKNSTSAAGNYQGQRVKRTSNRPGKNGRGERQSDCDEDAAIVPSVGGNKAGNLVGIPWRIAFALQADGWFLRRDNIWFKSNPMPESVSGWRWEKHRIKGECVAVDWKIRPKAWQVGERSHDKIADGNYRKNGDEDTTVAVMEDCLGCEKCAPNGGLILRKGNWRCTTSHEYVFQFSKSSSYFCDAEAAREKSSGTAHHRGHGVNPKAIGRGSRFRVSRNAAENKESDIRHKQNRSFSAAVYGLVTNRNMRSVWRLPTRAFRGAHFATFPPDLVRPIIKAASPRQCCGACGGPYASVVERGEPRREQQWACGGDDDGDYLSTGKGKYYDDSRVQNSRTLKQRILHGMVEKNVVGYRPTCDCDEISTTTPAVVLDPFAGSGTVAQVSLELGRAAIAIEISPKYIPMIRERCASVTGPLNL